MSTGTAPTGSRPTPTASGTSAPTAERERYIERQLRRTRRQVRGVEITSRLILLAAAAVVYFLVAAVFDHWLVPGGLSVYGRLAFLAVFLAAAGWFAVRELIPLFVYRINPLFAAHTIERAKPTLKNSLLNFLMLRSNRAAVPDVVLGAVEEQAAVNLQRTPIEHVVDHTRVIQLGYLLLAAVAAFCAYYLLSPKSPLQTVGRVVLPWADLQPPSRVQIDDIEPGTATVFRGQRATISAAVRGLDEGEQVTLYFTTADRQNVDQPVRMFVSKDSYNRHTVTLPPQSDIAAASAVSSGLQQDIEYRIEAGDAVSHTHRLTVVQAPNIVVEKLVYAYPEYTRLASETVNKTGDIRAVEGTQVTIHATANQPIAAAYVDLGGEASRKQPMKVDGEHATTTLTLSLNDERSGAAHSYYYVRFQTPNGHENPEPIRYRIEVMPDPAPELQLSRPDKIESTVPLNAPVEFELEATDPMYGLSDLRIVATVGGEPAFRRNHNVPRHDDSAARAVFKHVEHLDRITLEGRKKLKPGDVVEYWAEAVDNKTPHPNVTKTEVRKLTIADPQQQQNQDQQRQGGNGQQNPDQQNGNNQDQKNQPNNQQPNERRNNDAQNNDEGNNNAGQNDANNKQPPQDNHDQQRQPDRNNQKRGNNQQQPGNNEQQRGNNDQNRNGTPGDQNNQDNGGGDANQQQPNDNAGANEQQRQPNNADNSGQQRGDQKDGGKANQNNNAGNESAGNEKTGNEKTGNEQSGNEQSGNDRTGGQQKASPNNGSQGNRKESQPGEQSNDGGQENTSSKTPNNGTNNDHNNAKRQGGAKQEDQRPVDQSDEGEAFDRILNHAKENGGKSPDQNNARQPQGSESQHDPANNEGASNQEKSDGDAAQEQKTRPDGTQNDPSQTRANGQKSSDTDPRKETPSKNNPPTTGGDDPRADQQEDTPQYGENDNKSKGPDAGSGDDSGKKGMGKNENRAGAGAKGPSDPADKGASTARQPGAGKTGDNAGDQKTASGKTGKTGDEKGPGSKAGRTQDVENQSGEQANGKEGSGGDPNSDETKEAGQEGGAGQGDDRSPANRKGTAKQTSDQGESKDRQKGKTPASQQNGSQQKVNQASDSQESGGKKAKGTEGNPKDGNAENGNAQNGDGKKGEAQESDAKEGSGKASPNRNQKSDGRGPASPIGGGGTPEGDVAEPPDFSGQLPSDDKANLDYARRATDLALDHLRNQLKNGQPDQDLLDNLGWSKDDLQKLLSRWETMQREAQQPGPQGAKAKENLQEAIQSLGWKRPGQARRRATTKGDDAARALRDSARSTPPAEYIKGFEAFRRRTSGTE